MVKFAIFPEKFENLQEVEKASQVCSRLQEVVVSRSAPVFAESIVPPVLFKPNPKKFTSGFPKSNFLADINASQSSATSSNRRIHSHAFIFQT